jgi:hypothetical protein
MIPGSSRSWIAVKTIKSKEVPNYALIRIINNDSNRNTFNKLLPLSRALLLFPLMLACFALSPVPCGTGLQLTLVQQFRLSKK